MYDNILEEIHNEFINSENYIQYLKELYEYSTYYSKQVYLYIMKSKIRITESELINLIKKVIKEEEYSEQHLEYNHPRAKELELENDGRCTIQIAQNRNTNNYSPVLVCTKYNQSIVSAELPAKSKNVEDLKHFICNHIERSYELLDEMLGGKVEDDEELNEDFTYDRFQVLDNPIVCSSELF